jgi:hypothetical protein
MENPPDSKELHEEKSQSDNERLDKIKAIDITIDSLKQYISLSTISIAGLIAFYNGNGKNGIPFYFVFALICFVFCALASVITINMFISMVNEHEYNVRKGRVRTCNWIAIISFFIGITSGGVFFHSSFGLNYENPHSEILIKPNKIRIGKDVKTNIQIKTDSAFKVSTIIIN